MRPSPKTRAGSEGLAWARRGSAEVAAGNLTEARRCFEAAVRQDRNNPDYRYHLALLQQAIGDRCAAAEHLTVALRLNPRMTQAAERLAEMLSDGILAGRPRFDEAGLIAALAVDTIDRDLIAAASLHHLSGARPLKDTLDTGRREGWDAAARIICLSRRHDLIASPLFLEVLERGIVARSDVERLLAAIRRALLLEPSGARLDDERFSRFAVALMRQCWLNEYVWPVSEAERRALDALVIDPEAVSRGDREARQRFLIACLYRAPETLFDLPTSDAVPGPRTASAFGDALRERLAQLRDIRERGARLPSYSALADDISHKVAGQYEAHPYPRWTSVPLFPKGGYLDHIKPHFKPGQLAFASRPFEVLIAGCGTGRQAVSAAFDYGANARITGVDISRASLGYASLMADRMGARNLQLAHGDLNRILDFKPSFRDRFHIIECGGVLHHMADPFEAWRKLNHCLAPGGILLIGLYSRIARRNLALLRSEPVYPGAGASDDALRAYRSELFGRSGAWPGAELIRGRDAYSLSGFRDYFLHVNEHTTSLPEIGSFLAAEGLAFRGFIDGPFEALRAEFPEATAPGDLALWHAWEERHPNAFAGMYQFWCARV